MWLIFIIQNWVGSSLPMMFVRTEYQVHCTHIDVNPFMSPDQVTRASTTADFQSFNIFFYTFKIILLPMSCYCKSCCFRYCLHLHWIHFLLRHLNRVLYFHLSYLPRTKQNHFPPYLILWCINDIIWRYSCWCCRWIITDDAVRIVLF